MSAFAHNVTLLHLLKQDTESLSLDELYSLYLETFQQVQESFISDNVVLSKSKTQPV